MRTTNIFALSSVSLAALAIATPAGAKTAAVAGAGAAAAAQPSCPTPDAQGNCSPSKNEARPPEQLPPTEQAIESGRAEPGQQIVVTGTRINRPTLVSPVPVTSVGTQDLASQGNVSLGDKLAQLPQIRATFTQANSTRFIGTSGINALDLRGLGTARTLVLVNGRRIVTATPGVNRPDVNSIPQELIERIDIVTGGNSAIYGSDAVAGVVNFITKRDFEGIRLDGQGGISSRGDRGSYYLSATAGRNFADGRANVAVSAEYAKQETLYFTDRDAQTGAFSGRHQFQATDITGPIVNPTVFNSLGGPNGTCRVNNVNVPCILAEPAAGDAIPDTTFLFGIRNNGISEGGLFTATCPNAAATGESAAAFAARRAAACTGIADPTSTNPLAQFGNTYVFLPDGTLIRNPCTNEVIRQTGTGNCVGGLGSTLRLTGMLEPGLTRRSITMLAHYDVSEAFSPFIEATYSNVHANQEGQPTFFTNSFRLDNPFLSSQARTLIQSTLSPTAAANPATTFSAQRFDVDFGGRGEKHKRESYQIVGGVQGTFNGDWKYEASINYGHLYTYYATEGNVLRANYANAIDAVRDSVTGQTVCRINSSQDLIPAGQPNAGQINTGNNDPACVPINLFGNGAPSQEALNYILYKSFRKQRASLANGIAYMSGDSSGFFNLPGGPINFVLGAEYRRETAFAAYDPITSSDACGPSGCTFLNVIPDFRPPALKVWDLFGEINIPILKDLPFAQELSIDAAARYSHYNLQNTRGVFAWNVNGVWAPIRDLRFRAGYARSIRAPTLSDIYASPSQTFINNFVDPCGQQNINNGPQVNGQSVRIANCAAAGVPTTQTFTLNGVTTTETFSNRPASGISANNQGNPLLREEKGTSLTIGAVLQPRFLPGFSLTADYYNIKVKKVIQALGGQQIVNLCYDNTQGINNPFCAVVFRNPNGTFAGQSNVNHGGGTVNLTPTGPSVLIQSFNFAKLITSGLDLDMAYRRNLGGNVTLNLRGVVSRVFKKTNFTDPTDPTFQDRILSELGDPKWQGQFSTNLTVGMFTFGHRIRYVDKMTVAAAYETQHEFQGRPPTNADAFPRIWYPRLWFNDFRIDVKPTRKYGFYVGVDNAFDRLPPLDLLGVESGATDPVGRFFYAGAKVDF